VRTTWKVRLANAAERDIVQILQWTALHFGAVQAKTYGNTISMALCALAAGPEIAGVRKRDEIAPGLGSLHVARLGRKGRHPVLFRVGGEQTIDVVRVLHESMELARHLRAPDEKDVL
jgi:toxin ParE1/3/4